MREAIVALAGRRIDAPDDKTPRFPLENVKAVRERIRGVLKGRRALVCSAACGADLIALEQASAEGMRRRVVLPFPKEHFRETSVVDRPGDWGSLFDQIIEEVERSGELVVLPSKPDDEDAYAKASAEILEQAARLETADLPGVLAVVVWDGASRGPDDLTAAFLHGAKQGGYATVEVATS